MRISKDCWQCEYPDCGHVWIAAGVDPPGQCAKCRRRKWHTEVDISTAKPEPKPSTKPSIPAPSKLNRSVEVQGDPVAVEPSAGSASKPGRSKVENLLKSSSPEWSPTSRCKHGWTNSFVCRANKGGC